jgi:peroxiredoxin Q/BCP
MPKPGTPAPQFSLPISDGSLFRSSDYIGRKPIVLFFYPKDDTLGCTVEACAFRDAHAAFVAAGAEVIGISADPVASHLRFQEKHSLPFVLASDVNNEIARAYGVTKGLFGLPGRATFIIDKRGIVRDVFSSRLRVKRHVSRALDLIRALTREPE